jgi:hypothetical protein
MRKALAVLILAAAVALNAAAASAGGSTDTRPLFFGDGFDNTTCADTPRAHGCY